MWKYRIFMYPLKYLLILAFSCILFLLLFSYFHWVFVITINNTHVRIYFFASYNNILMYTLQTVQTWTIFRILWEFLWTHVMAMTNQQSPFLEKFKLLAQLHHVQWKCWILSLYMQRWGISFAWHSLNSFMLRTCVSFAMYHEIQILLIFAAQENEIGYLYRVKELADLKLFSINTSYWCLAHRKCL